MTIGLGIGARLGLGFRGAEIPGVFSFLTFFFSGASCTCRGLGTRYSHSLEPVLVTGLFGDPGVLLSRTITGTTEPGWVSCPSLTELVRQLGGNLSSLVTWRKTQSRIRAKMRRSRLESTIKAIAGAELDPDDADES